MHVHVTGWIRSWRWLIVIAVFVLVGLVYQWSAADIEAAVWKDPTGCSPPADVTGCPIGAPLNTSNSIQTKSGDLTLLNGLVVSNPADLVVGDSTPPDTPICWNGVCKNNWNDAGQSGNFVPVFNAACAVGCGADGLSFSAGYASITAPDATLAAWHARASQPAGSTRAIWGRSDPLSTFSYGIYARAGNNSQENAALFASAPAGSEAWAAYFAGDVRVAGTWDLVVGGNGLPSNNGSGDLCLASVCRRDWPPLNSGDAYWIESGNYYQVVDPVYHLAIGSNGPGAPFFVQTVPSQFGADLIVRGSGHTATAAGSSDGLTIE